jgi:hypothetical protein
MVYACSLIWAVECLLCIVEFFVEFFIEFLLEQFQKASGIDGSKRETKKAKENKGEIASFQLRKFRVKGLGFRQW